MGAKRTRTVPKVILVLLFVILSIMALFPLYALLLGSMKPATEFFRYGLNVRWDFSLMSFKNYQAIFEAKGAARHYFTWYKNSIVITVLFTVISLLLSSLVGYGLAMYKFVGRNLVFSLVLLTMMVPVEIIILPLYKEMIALRLINTIWGIILPFAVAPLPIFFFRQFALSLPKEFMDAARMDGCSEGGVFFRIMMPLLVPAYASMAILQALASWNNFLWPIIVLRTTDQFTLPIGLATFLSPLSDNYDVLIAGAVLSIVPIFILFVFFQRFFIEGLTVGGVKG
ncbi:carbohydrate ABC transporter permease [Paenibacillus sp. OAS669]|uniref:carbohydrate ABC transporter permease n=1 Tax=Paenibacillus sp. OAS669 TaxID=2663821 RepID=UPI0017899BEF|nr:carbohydrate ABC transporter permease [Paenibacillus sp. OAS669]MBE1440933.1 arabinosaccharide transport system permease protein [Paenibacillus sp. OAS669]